MPRLCCSVTHVLHRAAAKREITVTFISEVQPGLPWTFTPCQKQVRVRPGQSTLVFYNATNTSSEDITGVSTYNVSPAQVCAAPGVCCARCVTTETRHLDRRVHLQRLPGSDVCCARCLLRQVCVAPGVCCARCVLRPRRLGCAGLCVAVGARHVDRLGQFGEFEQDSSADPEQESNTDSHSARNNKAQAAHQSTVEPGKKAPHS